MPLIKEIYSDSQLFHDLKRMDRDNFSYEGAKALQEYLEQLSEDIGENITYDPIAFCCEYSEYSDLDEIKDNYKGITDMDDLRDHTQVIEFTGGIIIQDY